jgi:hypothetical protein
MQIHNLRNAVTVLPVHGIAVQTKAGLIDMGLHDAFAKDGSLIWTNDNNTAKASSLNRKLNRIETLVGGIKPKVVFFFFFFFFFF